MIGIDLELLRRLAAEARLAPSVHNIQPTRLVLVDGGVELHADPARRLPAADPTGHDVRLSHGSFLEGLALALGRAGLAVTELDHRPGLTGDAVARLAVAASSMPPDPLAEIVPRRTSWRGAFRPLDVAAAGALDGLALQDGLLLLRDSATIGRIAALADRAGLHFLRDGVHRRELLDWMRLSPRHPDYDRDGLNAEALVMGRMEAWGAGIVLGPAFGLLDRVGLAAPLAGDAGKTRKAGALALFHRPVGEDPFVTGRAFYRAWLAVEAAGFAGCPVSVLVDWPESRRALEAAHPLPAGRRLVNVFRIGLPAGRPPPAHFRLPVSELVREA